MDVKSLFKNVMTSDILDNHDIKEYYSGRLKEIGDKFVLGMLLVPDHREDIEIVFDLCEKDITEDEVYSLMYIKTHRTLRLNYFKLKKTNSLILKNLKKSLDVVQTEEDLENLKSRITKEIELRNSKIKKVV